MPEAAPVLRDGGWICITKRRRAGRPRLALGSGGVVDDADMRWGANTSRSVGDDRASARTERLVALSPADVCGKAVRGGKSSDFVESLFVEKRFILFLFDVWASRIYRVCVDTRNDTPAPLPRLPQQPDNSARHHRRESPPASAGAALTGRRARFCEFTAEISA